MCLTSSLYLRFHAQLLGFSAGSLTKTDTQFSQHAALTVKQSLWGESHRFSVTETHKHHHLNALMTDGHSWVPEGWSAESYTPVSTQTQKWMCNTSQSFGSPTIMISDLPFSPVTANCV